MFDAVEIGRRISRLRKEKDMTQPALADVMGVSFQAVSNWERGASMPDIGKLPGLDCVSIGPNLLDIHTPRERMEIASVQRVWRFVLEVLKRSK